MLTWCFCLVSGAGTDDDPPISYLDSQEMLEVQIFGDSYLGTFWL